MKPEKAIELLVKKYGTKLAVSRALNVHPVTITNWAKGKRKISHKRIQEVIKISEGQLTEKDLRPDIFG